MLTHKYIKNALIFFISLLVVLLIYISFRDVNEKYDHILQGITHDLKETSSDIRTTLNNSEIHLKLISNVLESHHDYDATDHRELENIVYFSDSNQFYADVTLGEKGSSLSGTGNFDTLDEAILDEVYGAAFLTPFFETAKENLQSIQWIYYVSQNNFINIHPRVAPSEYMFTPNTVTHDFFTEITPTSNPERSIVATKIYEDEAGAGMMVTLSKPIYHHNTFRGALAIDITLDELEEIVQLGTSTDSEYFLINQYGEIIATNKTDAKDGVVPIAFYLDTLGIDESEFFSLEDNIYHQFNDYLVKKMNIQLFDWQLIVINDLSKLYFNALGDQLLIGVVIFLLITIIFQYSKKVHANLEAYNNQLKFEQVVNQAVQLMAVLDLEGRILFVNQTAVSMIDVASDQLVGEFFYDTPWWNWSQELISFIKFSIEETRLGGHPKRDVIHYDLNGDVQHIEFSMSPIYNQNNQIEYLVANGKNITDRVKLNDSMNRLLKSDPLTNLGNRRAIIESMEKEISKFERKGTCFSVLLLDVDYFKNVNDTYGHNVGDEVLKRLSQSLKDQVRNYDDVGRWGGEEFIIVLPETAYDDAMQLAERICSQIKDMKMPCMDISDFDHITLTIGVAVYDEPLALKEIIKHADDALYFGKAHGRNQVVGYRDMQNE
ncbi:sensor domain-containing diguanylate cyclase [Fusibacter sp. JL216-2]|uniref:sensor domain-containing diguanylate cyclase n=1 Tax=Fusibacter sp. JL216-2 TaxID=3071453 RepID=UPI003D33C9E2